MVEISLYMANILSCLFLGATIYYIRDSEKQGLFYFTISLASFLLYFLLGDHHAITQLTAAEPSIASPWYLISLEQTAFASLSAALILYYQAFGHWQKKLAVCAIIACLISPFIGAALFGIIILTAGLAAMLCNQKDRHLGFWLLTLGLFIAIGAKIIGLFGTFERYQLAGQLALNFGLVIMLLEEYKEVLVLRANSDPLSGLPNRRSLNKYADRLFQHQQEYWLVLIQIDGVKQINDAYGYAVGDHAIQRASETMRSHVGKGEFLGRNFAKEFVLISTRERGELLATLEQLQADIASIKNLDEHKVSLSLHCGISQNSGGKEQFSYALKASSAALLYAESHKLTSVFVTNDMLDSVNRRLDLENALREAIQEKTLSVNFQPKFDCDNPEIIVGAEALARWTYKGEFISPFEFIALAEECNLIADLDQVIMEKAWRVGKSLEQQGCPVKIAANFSPTSLLAGVSLTDMVRGIIDRNELNPHLIEIEITESYLAHGSDINAQLQELKDIGISVAMDDFGTGFSNLGQLEDLPLDTLKIDKIFIDKLLENPTVTEFIVDLAQKLQLQLVAEGVEEERQLEWLHQHRCHTIQGYLLSKPLPEDEFVKLILKSSGNKQEPPKALVS